MKHPWFTSHAPPIAHWIAAENNFVVNRSWVQPNKGDLVNLAFKLLVFDILFIGYDDKLLAYLCILI